MKRIKITAICMSLLTTLALVGCVCPPASYHSGMYYNSYIPSHTACESGCDPCGSVDSGCGVIEYDGNPCASSYCTPQYCVPRIANCRSTFSNLGNGVLLIGRGILDVTAAPFVLAGNVLSSGCRYEVLSYCDTPCVTMTSHCPIVEPCGSAYSSGCSSGCDTCAGGYSDGIQYNTSAPNTSAYNSQMMPLPPPRRSNGIIHASYQEPTAPVRFVQPR
jgi:hypothetical protein